MVFTSRTLRLRPLPPSRPPAGVLVVIGEVDALACDSFREQLADFVDAHDGDVIVDLSDVRLIAAAGVRVLLDTADRLAGTTRRLRLVCGAEVRRVLRAAQVTDVLETFAHLDAAVGAQAAALHRTAASRALDGGSEELHRLRREVGDLRAKLRTRPLLSRALGVLQERYGLPDEDTAHRLLSEASQRHNLKMRVLADALLHAPRPASTASPRWFPGRSRTPAPPPAFLPPGRRHALDPAELLDALLQAALACTATAAGYAQRFDPGVDGLRLERHEGLPPDLVALLADVGGDGTCCGLALRRRSRVTVEDVANSLVLPAGPVNGALLRAGLRAVQSTPVLAPSGRCLAVVSTCAPEPGRTPTTAQQAELDRLAAEAGRWLQWHQRTTVLDALEHLHQRAREGSAPGGR